jgi:primosomal protein N'
MAQTRKTLVSVLVDDVMNLGALTYSIPAGMVCSVGDAVSVPFGKTSKHGLVIGPGVACKAAVKDILKVYGARVSVTDLQAATEIASAYYSSLAQVAQRLSPRSNRNSAPLAAGDLVVDGALAKALPVCQTNWRERVILKAPLSSSAELAAAEAERLINKGQVLILCPSVSMVEAVLAQFASGAARLDSKARAGAWNGWRTGTVKVGIGTRSAALYSASKLDGIIVVDEEHPGHREACTPYTHSRQVSQIRARLHKCHLSYISGSPSPQAMRGTKVLTVNSATKLWPKATLIDRREVHPSMASNPPLVHKILGSGNLRNYVLTDSSESVLMCTRCKTLRPCTTCDTYCKHQPKDACPTCAGKGVAWVGWGSQRLKALYTTCTPITVKDLDLLGGAPKRIVIPNFEGMFRRQDINADQQNLSILMRVTGAAGPKGEIIVLYSNSNNILLKSLVSRDTMPIVEQIWADAKQHDSPPFGYAVTIRSGQKNAPDTSLWPGVVYGPRKTSEGWETRVHCRESDYVTLKEILVSLRQKGKTRIVVD